MFRSSLRIACLALCLGASALAVAADPAPSRRPFAEIELGKLTDDTQRVSSPGNQLNLVWWIPPEFWAASATQSGETDAKKIDEVARLFSKYTIVAVVKGEMGVVTMGDFMGEDQVRDIARVIDSKGRKLEPVPTKKLEPDLVILLGILKPILKSMIGPAGENMHFLAFPAKDASGVAISDPYRNGELVVMLGDQRFAFKTPLPSLLSPMYDMSSGEAFPGTYRFNPYTGNALTPDKR
ncbi:MAG: hypothetical protein IT473_15140 [Lysobacter sp.]|nr:hypothetical protein [Lysobacter sp.]